MEGKGNTVTGVCPGGDSGVFRERTALKAWWEREKSKGRWGRRGVWEMEYVNPCFSW